MLITKNMIEYKEIPSPKFEIPFAPVHLSDETIEWRKEKVLAIMAERKLDTIVIYGDREHWANLGYLAGFEIRFEEGLMILHSTGEAYMLLGNEALRMAQFSRIPVTAIHVPYFSLPNQPMENEVPLTTVFQQAKIKPNSNLGLIGWKMFTSEFEDNKQIFDLPYYIVDAIKEVIGTQGTVVNACDIFIDPDYGVRSTVNANEIAHYEYGAALASSTILRMLDAIEIGKTELELGNLLTAYGQPTTVQTICATGERFTNAVVTPRAKKVTLGDRFATSMGLRGGLTNRTGYIAHTSEDLPLGEQDYMERVVKPYFAAVATWYSNVGIGVEAGDVYEMIENVAPQTDYGWKLNPGHLTSNDEWMSSPFYPNSSISIKSGMMIQMDIIFSVPGYSGSNAEDGVAIADEALRRELEHKYPEVWNRILMRKKYLKEIVGISLKEEVLPLSNTQGYLRPLLLNKDMAMTVKP